MKIRFDAKLKFNMTTTKFLRERNLELGGKVQRYIDSACLRLMEPYLPFWKGRLTRSGQTLTQIGSGIIRYKPIAPDSRTNKSYAAWLYYNPKLKFRRAVHVLAGAYWFRRMAKDKQEEILKGACEIAGAKPNS